MANKFFRKRKMSPIQKVVWQLTSIRKTYENIESSHIAKNGFVCILNMTPSENSDTYKVEISYTYGYYPKARLLSHKLEKRNGLYPHHIYGIDEDGCARLCVFHKDIDKWDSSMLIGETFIPWVSTWLNAYEFWLITGGWHYDEVIDEPEQVTQDGVKKDIINKIKD